MSRETTLRHGGRGLRYSRGNTGRAEAPWPSVPDSGAAAVSFTSPAPVVSRNGISSAILALKVRITLQDLAIVLAIYTRHLAN